MDAGRAEPSGGTGSTGKVTQQTGQHKAHVYCAKKSDNVENDSSRVRKGGLREAPWRGGGALPPAVRPLSTLAPVGRGCERCVSLELVFPWLRYNDVTGFRSRRFCRPGVGVLVSRQLRAANHSAVQLQIAPEGVGPLAPAGTLLQQHPEGPSQ